MRIPKTIKLYIVQGAYGQGWEDVAASETRKEAYSDLRAYRENETQCPHRLITRREANPDYVPVTLSLDPANNAELRQEESLE